MECLGVAPGSLPIWHVAFLWVLPSCSFWYWLPGSGPWAADSSLVCYPRLVATLPGAVRQCLEDRSGPTNLRAGSPLSAPPSSSPRRTSRSTAPMVFQWRRSRMPGMVLRLGHRDGSSRTGTSGRHQSRCPSLLTRLPSSRRCRQRATSTRRPG